MITAAEFLVGFPEFSAAGTPLVEAKLADADATTSVDAFAPAVRDRRVALVAARLLALSPFGRDMKLVSDDGATVYDDTIRRMDQCAVFGRGRVA